MQWYEKEKDNLVPNLRTRATTSPFPLQIDDKYPEQDTTHGA